MNASPQWSGARSIVTPDGNKIVTTGGVTKFVGRAGGLPKAQTVATLRAERAQVFTITPRAIVLIAADPTVPGSTDESFQNFGPAMLVRWGVGQADASVSVLAVQPMVVVADNIDVLGYITNVGGNLRPGWPGAGPDYFQRLKCDFRCFIGPGNQPPLPAYWNPPYNGVADRFFLANVPGVLRSAVGYNAGAARVYLMFFDWTARANSQYGGAEVPDGSSPDLSFPVDPGQAFSYEDRHGFPFGTGLAWYASSTPTTLTKDVTAAVTLSANFISLCDALDQSQI